MSAAPDGSPAEAAVAHLLARTPFVALLGVRVERMGDELTLRLPFRPALVGNPVAYALHGGAIGALLESAALLQLGFERALAEIAADAERSAAVVAGRLPPAPRTIDITIDYLRPGRARDSFARAHVAKVGRRVANVRVEAWQDRRAEPIAALHGHFLTPEPEPAT